MRRQRAIGSRVLENYDFLRKIAKSKSEKKRLSKLRNASKDELLSLVEVASNVLSSNFSLNNRQKERLVPHAEYIRKLARSRSEIGARKVVQTGNGAFLASLLIPVVTEAARLLLTNSSKGVVEDN